MTTTETKLNIFISRAGKHKGGVAFAIRLYDWLTADGHYVELQDRTFGTGDFQENMNRGMKLADDENGRIIALYTPEYFNSGQCLKEARYPLINDPHNDQRKLIPLKIAPCSTDAYLKAVAWIDMEGVLAQNNDDLTKQTIYRALGLLPEEPSQPIIWREPSVLRSPQIRHVPNFVGRAALFRDIADTRHANTPIALTALHGMGGIGKSAAAMEYAARYAENYSAVWLIPSESKDIAIPSLKALGNALTKTKAQFETRQQDLDYALTAITNWTSEKKILLIYDNAPNPETVKDFIPPESAPAHILLTSRYGGWRGRYGALQVDALPEPEAVALLLELSGRADESGARALVQRLGYLPLALTHAGTYLSERKGLSFADYEAELDKHLDWAPDEEDAPDYRNSVWAALKLSLDALAEADAEAFARLGALAWLAPEPIPREALAYEAEVSKAQAEDWLAVMVKRACLNEVELPDGSDGVQLHRLMRDAVRRERADDESIVWDSRRALVMCADGAHEAGDQQDVRNWPAFERYLPHCLELAEIIADNHPAHKPLWIILNQIAIYLEERADYAGAEPHFRRNVKLAEEYLSDNDTQLATSLNNLARLLHNTNRHAEAEPLYKRALRIVEASYGPNHPRVAINLNNLAELLRVTNRHEEAEPLYRRALKIDEASFGQDHPNVAIRLNNLALLLAQTGRAREALPLSERHVIIYENSLPHGHPRINEARANRDQIQRMIMMEQLPPEILAGLEHIATLPESEQEAAMQVLIAKSNLPKP